MVFASANLFWDALFHLVMTPILDRYSPGVVTAMLLDHPICILVIVIIRDKILTARQFVLALLGGRQPSSGSVVWYGLFHFAT